MIEKILQTERLAKELIQQHGLDDWTFEFSKTKHIIGHCDHSKKKIQYSLNYLAATADEEIKDTILHEIAHALVGTQHGHDEVWRMKCVEIGARPERTSCEAVTTAKPNYVIKCPNCGWQVSRYRLRRKLLTCKAQCPDCKTEVKFYKVK